MGSAILGFLWRFRLPIVVVLCLSAAYYKGRGDEDAKWRAAAAKAEVEWTQKVSDAEKQALIAGLEATVCWTSATRTLSMRSRNTLPKSLALPASVCLLTLSSGCAVFSKPDLPDPPATLTECSEREEVDIPAGPKSKEETAGLTAEIRRSEKAFSRCSKAWPRWYDSLRGQSSS